MDFNGVCGVDVEHRGSKEDSCAELRDYGNGARSRL